MSSHTRQNEEGPEAALRRPILSGGIVERGSFNPGASSASDLERLFSAAGMAGLDVEPSHMSFRVLRVPGFTVTRYRVASAGGRSQSRWEPRPGKGEARHLLLFVARGQLEIEAPADRYAQVGEGLMMGFPGRDPISFSTDTSLEAISVSFEIGEVYPHEFDREKVQGANPDRAYLAAAFSALEALVNPRPYPKQIEPAPPIRSFLAGIVKGVLLQIEATSSDSVLRDALVIIADQYMQPALSPDQVASQLGIGPSTLRRHFIPYGLSPSAEIRRHRVAHAKRLLRSEKRYTHAEVAKLTGFGSVDSLRRALKLASG